PPAPPAPPSPLIGPVDPAAPSGGGNPHERSNAASSTDHATVAITPDDVHIKLPPGVGQDVQDAIDEAVDDAAAQKVETYRERGSDWFMNFVLLLVLGLFGTKALMGGKKRAEAQAAVANAIAEREAMQRQVTEAKMQMMQAQVEPHFLFNTLASVEYLIETDPPRASRMQRSLIQYLRAVIPQMRENAPVTNLGREVDMVSAYLDLLKMRMEERLIVECQIPPGLRSAAFPPMMLQSLVENAIKHGLECKPEGGTLRISAAVTDYRLQVAVTDTGLGFGAVASDGTGLGLQNIRERLKLLHGANGQLTIAPNQPSGVIATIDVPYQLAK
ncbi:MAG: histidine kinase, partial [Pseudomonadota bacterium]|nr:histidine kinase [Pseudomonadota bacterium]